MAEFPAQLIEGYKKFREGTYLPNQHAYELLADKGQSPDVLVIGCSDSRVNPNEVFAAGPGELFIIRNVANLVPPYETLGAYHGVSAALEFAVLHLEVGHVVVLGHTGCGGVKAMLDPATPSREDMTFISSWVSMMSMVRDDVVRDMADAPIEEQVVELEKRSIMASLVNLRSFPFVKSREDRGFLQLHGSYFDVGSGNLLLHHAETGTFQAAD